MATAVPCPSWREELADWCRAFGQAVDGHWDGSVIGELFERIEQLCTTDVGPGSAELAERAAELMVYLCTFADGEVVPDADQRAHLRELNGKLGELHAPADRAAPDAGPEAAAKAPPLRIFLVRPADSQRPELSAALGLLKCSVQALDSIDAARVALVRERPDAVIVDAGLLSGLPTLIEGARRYVSDNFRHVLWAAVGVEEDLRLRLFARRAGIDLLLETESAEQAAAALLATLVRRREERFRVLLVEDDRSQAAYAASLLRHQGLTVEHAETAVDALALIGARAPDLVLLDIHLPDMSGLELAQLIREQDHLTHVPLIFLTGEESEEARDEAIAAGGDDFLTKPIRPRHLIANVNSRIGRARALAAAAPVETTDAGLPPRRDRVRFVEAIERTRRESDRCLALAAVAMDDVAAVVARLGFVGAGELGAQIALAIDRESPGSTPICAVGEFSRLVLLDAATEAELRQALQALLDRLHARTWLAVGGPLEIGFSAGAVRYDGGATSADAIIAAALAELTRLGEDGVRRGLSLARIGPT